MSEISELTIHLDAGKVLRVTPDGKRVSAFDVISAAGHKSPREIWKRIAETYPDVVTGCDDFTFFGRGQKPTPTLDRRAFVRLTFVLPGKTGDLFRLHYLDIVLAWWDGRSPKSTDLHRQALASIDSLTYENALPMMKVLVEKAVAGSVGACRAYFAAVESLRRGALLTSLQTFHVDPRQGDLFTRKNGQAEETPKQ